MRSTQLRLLVAPVALGGMALSALAITAPTFVEMRPVGANGPAPAPLKVLLADGKADATPLIFTGALPGDEFTQRFWVDGPEGLPFVLSLRTSNIRDEENGCTDAEVVDDPGCTDDVGEMSSTATLTVLASMVPQGAPCDFTSPQHRLQARTLTALDVETPQETLVVPRHQDACVELRLALPASTGNETQSDSTTFDLVWTAVGMHKDG